MKGDAMGGFAWVTLATNDSYSLGALVLAHSLKKSNTAHKLAVLITPAVSQPMREQLQTVFDVVKSVDVLDSKDEAHLALLKRPELGITFTKIHCWRLTEFEKCVFLDADTLVVRNCDELFEREEFSAAPDVSWPDCFNSGVFVYKPSVDTFNKLLQFAVEKGSFDGGDQGLLNQFFSDWATEDIKKHLPFVYNLTSVAAYSYIPAFKQYGAQTRIVHFIGAGKPWLQQLDPGTKTITPTSGSEHLAPLLQQWWDLFCEKVHPNLSKNLENNNDGMSHPPVEARSNTPVALTSDEPQSPRLIEPCLQYREKDDFRQHNLPYQPFDVRGSSGELLNVEFLLASVVPQDFEDNSSEPQRPLGGELEEKEPEPKVQETFNDTEQTKPEIVCDEARVEEKPEEPPVPKDPFDYNTFFPDENCINNYLEQNLVTYQPIEIPHEDPQLENVPLPRFLTIPEDDQRQKGNIEVVEHQSGVDLPPAPPPTPQKPAEIERRQTPPPVERHELPKSKSMTFIPNDVIATDIPSPPRRSIWKSQPNVNIDPNRKYSMPRLKPLLPKQNPKPVQSPMSRVTLYTEFLMSADYKDPVDLPRDEVGFVERELRRSKSEADLKGRFGPLPYAKSPEVKIPEPRKPPLRELDNDAYDLSRCKRQLGNKPRVCAKENVSSNLITPTKDKKSTMIKKRKLKELSPGDGGKEKPLKKERKERPRHRKHENLDEILKRLWEFSKNYQHYFGVDAQNGAKERPIRPDFKQFRNFIKDKKETMQRGLLGIQDIMTEKGESANGTNATVQCVSELEVSKIGNGVSAAVEDGGRLKQSPDRCKVGSGKQSTRSLDQEQLTNNPVPGKDCLTTSENIPNGIKAVVDHSTQEPNDGAATLKINANQNVHRAITQNGDSLPETLSNGCLKSPVLSNVREKSRKAVTKQPEKETKPTTEPNLGIQGIVGKTIGDEKNTIKGRNNVEKDKPQGGWSLEEKRTQPQSEGEMNEKTPISNGKDSDDKLHNILENVECEAPSGKKVSERAAGGQRDMEDKQEDATPEGMFTIGSPKKSTGSDGNVASSQENKETAEVPERSKVMKPGNKPDEILCVPDYDTPRSSRLLTLTPQPDTDATPQAPPSSSIATSRKARIQRKPYENGTKYKCPVGKTAVKSGSDKHSAGIAGAIAQLSLESGAKGGESEAATTAAHQEYIRRQNWETGNMDYMGRDSFENIWSKICQTLEGKESDKATEGTHSPRTISTEEKTKPEGAAGAEAPVSLSTIIQKCPEFIDTLPSEPATGPAEDDEIIFTKPETGEKHLTNIKEEAENGDAGDKGSVKLSDILKPSDEPRAEGKSPEASAPQTEKDTTGNLIIKPEAPVDGVQSNQPESEMKPPSEEAKCTTVAIRQPILIPGASSEEPTPTKTAEAKLAKKKLQQKPETPTEPIPLPGPESLIQNECRTVAIPYPPTVATTVAETPEPTFSPSPEAPVMTSSKDEKQKKGVFSKLLEMVGVGPKVEEVSKSVFYTTDEAPPKEEVPVDDVKKDSEDVALESERKEQAPMEPETVKDENGEPIGVVKNVGQSLGVDGRNEKGAPGSKPTSGGGKKTSGKKSGQASMPKPERKASPKPSTQGSKNKSPSPLTIPQTPPETALTAATPTPPPDAPKRRNSALLKVDDSIPMTPPVGESGEAVKSEVEKIIEKAKTEVERRSAEKEVKESGDVMNALELMTGVESLEGKGKAEGVEELKVTSEEDRERHKGEAASSKLSDQILKAIPPPRRKAISDSKSEGSGSSGAIPKTPSPPGEKGKGKPSSIPVPPPRNKGKPSTTPAPPKGKTKK